MGSILPLGYRSGPLKGERAIQKHGVKGPPIKDTSLGRLAYTGGELGSLSRHPVSYICELVTIGSEPPGSALLGPVL